MMAPYDDPIRWLGWIPGILEFFTPGNEAYIWIAQIVELQKSFETIINLDLFPGNIENTPFNFCVGVEVGGHSRANFLIVYIF